MDVNYISGQLDSQEERNMTIVRRGSRVKRNFQNKKLVFSKAQRKGPKKRELLKCEVVDDGANRISVRD